MPTAQVEARGAPATGTVGTELVADDRLGRTLLSIARGAIARAVGRAVPGISEDDPRLHAIGGTFVTLRLASTGALHGCIGTLAPSRSIEADVRSNAIAAAFLDPRSSPLTPEGYDDIVVEVSLLGPIEPFPIESERDALARMRRDEGYVLSWGPMRGVLLPQVWDQCQDAAEFLRCLKIKAGIPPQFWAEGIHLQRFRLSKWRDERRSAAQHEGARH